MKVTAIASLTSSARWDYFSQDEGRCIVAAIVSVGLTGAIMASVIPANQVSIADLEDRYGLREASEATFFVEWQAN